MKIKGRDIKRRDQKVGPVPGSTGGRKFLFLRVGVGVLLSLLILQWIDFGVVVETITKAEFRYVVVIVGLALLDRYVMAYKWAILLRARGVFMSNREAFRIYIASGFVGTCVPFRAGADIFRLSRSTWSGARPDKVTASILMEKVLGLLAVTVLAAVGLSLLLLAHENQFLDLYYLTWAVLITLSVGLYVSLRPSTSRWLNVCLARFQKYRGVKLVLDSLHVFVDLGRQKRVLGWFFVLSLFRHGILIVMNVLGAKALGLPVTVIYFLAIIPISTFLGTLPISISGIGVTEGIYILLFSLAGMSAAQSLSLSLLVHRVVGVIMLIPGGTIFLHDSTRVERIQDLG